MSPATRISPHFTLEEMEKSANAEALGIDNKIPNRYISNAARVALALEEVRNKFGLPVTVLSCYRSSAVNKAVGGSFTSAHLTASAADFRIKGVSNRVICKWIADESTIPFDQVIYEFGELGWVHLGLRYFQPRRQALSAIKKDGKTVYVKGILEDEHEDISKKV